MEKFLHTLGEISPSASRISSLRLHAFGVEDGRDNCDEWLFCEWLFHLTSSHWKMNGHLPPIFANLLLSLQRAVLCAYLTQSLSIFERFRSARRAKMSLLKLCRGEKTSVVKRTFSFSQTGKDELA
ncbi:MAG: hypothetical protein SOY99_08170 [Alloprevotella sp.]|nr:hypothetical protein [Alloprevotella sp.]